MPPKTYHTAVVALPPPEVWEPIQAIRRQHDRHVHRWMPHITLLYPFLPHAQFGEALPVLTEVGRHIAPFQVTLTTFRAFTHRFWQGNSVAGTRATSPLRHVTGGTASGLSCL
jgi:2'-5' RNA ligase